MNTSTVALASAVPTLIYMVCAVNCRAAVAANAPAAIEALAVCAVSTPCVRTVVPVEAGPVKIPMPAAAIEAGTPDTNPLAVTTVAGDQAAELITGIAAASPV